MTERQAAAEIERLSAEIRRHEHAYHVLTRPEISDAEFDGLFATLVEMERRHPELARACNDAFAEIIIADAERLPALTFHLLCQRILLRNS